MSQAQQAAPNFAGVDFSRYQDWQVVRTPTGGTYYAVPGTAFVFDPFMSAARGQTVIYRNPTQRIEEEQRVRDAQNRQIEMQERASSPTGQLIPAAGTIGGAAATGYFFNRDWGSGTDDAVGAAVDTQPQTGGSLLQPGTVSQPAVPNAAQTPAQSFTGAATGAPQPIGSGTLPDGTPGTLMSDGTVQAQQLPAGTEVSGDGAIVDAKSGQVVGRVAQGAFGGYQIYNGYQQFRSGDRVGGALGMASGAANVGAALGSQTAGSFAGPLAVAAGGYQTFQGLQNGGEGLRSGLTNLGAGIGTMFLPGVGTGVGAAIGNTVGYGLQGDGIKNDLALAAVAPPILVAKKLGLTDKLIRKTTRQHAQEKTAELQNVAPEDQRYQDYVAGMRAQYNAAPPDPSKPFAGKYGSWDEYKKAGLEAADLTGVYGNIKTYGPEWAALTQEQRQAVTQANIDSGLYDSKKGDVIITDEKRARENFANVIRGAQTAAPAPIAPAPMPVATPVPGTGPKGQATPARSSTSSPGIGLDGKRIGQQLAKRMDRRR